MNNKIKMALDVVMTILFMSLMKISFTGLALHKIIGIGIFVLFITHSLLNYKWIISMCKNIPTGKVKGKSIFMFILNIMLFIITSFTAISGIIISVASNTEIWSTLHHFTAYTLLVLISIHIGLHWNMIIGFFKKAFKLKNENGTRTWVARAIALGFAILGIRALFNQDIQSNFTAPFTSVSQITKSKDSNDSQSTITNGLLVETTSLEDYLSNLHCSGCHNRCPLTNLKCSKGNTYKQQATTEYNQNKTQSSSSSTEITTDNSTSDVPTSEEYLSSLHCSGCHNRCLLTNLKCGKGNSYKEQALAEYKEKYPQSSESTNTASVDNSATPIDYLGLMSLIIAGTHYTITLPKKLK